MGAGFPVGLGSNMPVSDVLEVVESTTEADEVVVESSEDDPVVPNVDGTVVDTDGDDDGDSSGEVDSDEPEGDDESNEDDDESGGDITEDGEGVKVGGGEFKYVVLPPIRVVGVLEVGSDVDMWMSE